MGWGSSTRSGGSRKVRALPRKFVFLGFRREGSGMSQEFCRDVPDPWECSKSLCAKKVRAHFSFRMPASVLKRCVLKTLAFAFGLRLRSKTRCFKTRVFGRRLPNGKPQERLRFRALRGKTLAFKKTHCDRYLRFKDQAFQTCLS